MNDEKLIGSVFGDSGAGKTRLARAIVEEMGEDAACAINADYFLHDRNGKPLPEMTCDFALLASVISQPAGTLCHYPEYDFVAFHRIGLSGPLTFHLRRTVIVDQMHPSPNADVFIHLDMPFREAVDRLLQRDPPDWEWRALLAERWAEIPSVRDSDAVERLPQRLVLDATLRIGENLGRAIPFIGDAWKQRREPGAPANVSPGGLVKASHHG